MAPFEVEKQPPDRNEWIWGKQADAKLWKGATVVQHAAQMWKKPEIRPTF